MSTNTTPSIADSLIDRLSWRYAVKKFDATKRIPDAHWQTLEHALILSPSSYGLQPWKFIVITDPDVKAKLPAISWNQPQPRDCSHLVVFAARKGITPADVERYVQRIIEVRNIPAAAIEDYKKMMLGTINSTPKDQLDVWTARQTYIALGFLMSAAAMLSIDACPMEGIVAPEYDKLLGLEKIGHTATVACALGYRAADDRIASLKKVRYDAKDLVVRI